MRTECVFHCLLLKSTTGGWQKFSDRNRISGSERVEGGYGIETGIEIAKMLDGKVDLIHVSAGTNTDWYSFVLMHPGIFQKEGENANLAEEIRKHVKTPVVSVGAFTDPDFMEAFLLKRRCRCDWALGRSLIADPFLPKENHASSDGGYPSMSAMRRMSGGMMAHHCMRCTVNPLIGRGKRSLSSCSGASYRKNHDHRWRTGRHAGSTHCKRARSSSRFI